MIVAAVVSILLVTVLTVVIIKARKARRLAYIRQYRFHPSLKERVRKSYPELSEKQLEMVFKALRDYFHFCLLARKQMVAMPSQVVDVAWHEFILLTRHYQEFSHRAIGRFLHHTPTQAMKTPTLAHDGLKRVWRMACAHEDINPAEPKKLPLLFAIDGLLDIKDGFRYSLDCRTRITTRFMTPTVPPISAAPRAAWVIPAAAIQ